MIEWQQRVVDEKAALDEKLKALNAFVEKSPESMKLSKGQRTLLTRQSATMKRYSDILGERIALFESDQPPA